MKIYLKYILYATISFLFNVFVYITSPIWALIAAVFNINTLPGILGWLHTHDNDIYGQPHHPPAPQNFSERFKWAVWWLCRNPGYGFDSFILGFKESDIIEQIIVKEVGEFDTGNSAILHIKMKVGEEDYFCYRRDFALWGDRFIKTWFGWHHGNPQKGYRMLKIDFNPFKKKGVN